MKKLFILSILFSSFFADRAVPEVLKFVVFNSDGIKKHIHCDRIL